MAQDRNYRKSFVFHSEWLISIDEIENGEDQLLIYRAIVSYATRGIVPELPSYLRPVWKPFQIQIDNDVVKWNEIRDKRQAAGQRGGLAKQANATK